MNNLASIGIKNIKLNLEFEENNVLYPTISMQDKCFEWLCLLNENLSVMVNILSKNTNICINISLCIEMCIEGTTLY